MTARKCGAVNTSLKGAAIQYDLRVFPCCQEKTVYLSVRTG